jgi:basic membrane protein A
VADDIAMGDAGDDVARLAALTERQHELWGLLRDAEDEQMRNQLFDELTSNREELSKLKDAVGSRVDESVPPPNAPSTPAAADSPRSVGEQLRSNLLTPPEETAPSQPPPPPPPPPMQAPIVEPPIAEPVVDEPAATTPPPDPESAPNLELDAEPIPEREPDPQAVVPVAEPEPVASPKPRSSLAPEENPYPSREDDIAAMRGVVATPPRQEPAPQPTAKELAIEERRRLAHEAYQEIERVRPSHTRSFPVFAIIVSVLAVAIAAWYVLIYNRNGVSEIPAATTTTVASLATETGPGEQIQAVVNGMDVGSVMVEQRDGVVYLFGVLDSIADRTAVIGASEALAGDLVVDGTGLILSAPDEDLRASAIAAITAAGFDRINVTVSGTVATLTGVTPEEGTADLIAALTAVEGIEQVVDLTESADRAAALRNELNRLIAVTPIVYGSGEIAPTELHERVLDNVAEIILAYDGPVVTVVGYTDAAGTDEENILISQRRAEQVRNYLVSQGVPEERMVVEGRGEASASGSAAVAGLERRVEFEVGYVVAAGGDADFRIGIVAPSAANDLAFTQSIVDAANVIAAEVGGVGIDISDGVFVVDEAEAVIRGYAADGYDLVIAHGSQYGTSLAALAPEFPNTAFAWGTAADTFDLPNVSAYEVSANEGGYVLGVIAALISESDVIGVIGPLEVGDAQLFVDGFRNGALATSPAVDVRVTYIGSFSDVALAAGAATAHVEAGADVLTGSAQMVVGAVGVAAEADAAWLGNQANQNALAPDLVVASQVYHWEVALRQIVDGIIEGTLGGETYTLNLANGGVVIEYNPASTVESATMAAADEAIAGIIAGTVSTGF